MPNLNPKTKFIFPEESSVIVLSILEKHGLRETDEEFYEKWEKNKKTQGGILADLVIKIAQANIPTSELVNLIKEDLNITTQGAQKIIDDLIRKIIIPSSQFSKKIPSIGKLLSIEELKN